MFWKRYKSPLIVCGLVLVCYFLWYNKKAPDQDPKVVEVEVVSLKDMQRTETFIGTVQAKRSTVLVAKAQGVLDVVVHPGQQVKKDDVVARIIDPHSNQTYQLEEEKEKVAKIQFERLQKLHQQGAVSKNVLEEKKNAWLEASKSKVGAQEKFAHTVLQAPFDGIVGIFKVQEGSLVRDGDNIVSVFDPSTLEVRFDIPLRILSNIRDGASVLIKGQNHSLTHVQRMLDPATHMCPAYVQLQGDSYVIGATLDVEVVVEECKQVVIVPQSALFMQDQQTCVFRIEEGKAKTVKVTCGARHKDAVVITEGLAVGDKIIRCYPTRVYPGSKVRIAEEAS